MKTTEEHTKYWAERKIDWVKSYLELWDHPHRRYVAATLGSFGWGSLIEVGCASGPNIFHLCKTFPGRDIGGIDVNPDAIKVAKEVLEIVRDRMAHRTVFAEVSPGDRIFIGDKSTDVILTDMTLIYVSRKDIRRYLNEFRRVGRKRVVFYEFYSPHWWERLKLTWKGYHTHNYPKLLSSMGFDDVIIRKLPPEAWPESETHQKYGHIISAEI